MRDQLLLQGLLCGLLLLQRLGDLLCRLRGLLLLCICLLLQLPGGPSATASSGLLPGRFDVAVAGLAAAARASR